VRLCAGDRAATASQLAGSPKPPCLPEACCHLAGCVVEKAFDHERLEVYGVAIEFVAVAASLVEDLPRGRAYLADQLQRAAASIVLNIAEGAGERSAADKARFYRFACRSATESAAILDVIRTLELTDSTRLQPGREYLLRIVQMLVRLGQSLE